MRRKIVLSIISIILLTITGLTGTWAYLNYLEAYVNNMEFSAVSNSHALISVDGVNYKEDLSLDDMKKAIVAKYLNLDFDTSGNYINSSNQIVNLDSDDINKAYSKIQFSPLTSRDGLNIKYVNTSGDSSTVHTTSGMYVSFDLYFKSISEESFTLYFNTSDINSDLNETEVGINSKDVNINKQDELNFTSYNQESGELINNLNNESVTLNARDAMRFSTTVDEKTKIYEPYLGLGSYATNLDSELYTGYRAYSARYDSNKNAAFTYVKNHGFEYQALDYSDIPETYQGFEEMDAITVTTFDYINEVKEVTFNFWLEGYDADCFQALTGALVNVLLSFRGSDIIELYRINYYDEGKILSKDYINSAIRTGNTPYFPTKEGYVFDGWYQDEELSVEFDFNEVILKDNQTRDAYAKWRQI